MPAKVIKYRFNEEQRRDLLDCKWWEKPLSWIQSNAECFDDVDKVISRLKSEEKVDVDENL